MAFTLRPLAALALAACTAAQAYVDPVTQFEWRQLTETVGLQVGAANAVCSGSNHLCQGALNGVDLTGWHFASTQDVRTLFTNFGFPLSFNGSYYSTNSGGPLFDQFVDRDGASGPDTGAFYATVVDTSVDTWLAAGMTRDDDGSAMDPYDFSSVGNFGLDFMVAQAGVAYGGALGGLWLYREAGAANGLPLPGTAPLLLAALLAAGAARGRRKA